MSRHGTFGGHGGFGGYGRPVGYGRSIGYARPVGYARPYISPYFGYPYGGGLLGTLLPFGLGLGLGSTLSPSTVVVPSQAPPTTTTIVVPQPQQQPQQVIVAQPQQPQQPQLQLAPSIDTAASDPRYANISGILRALQDPLNPLSKLIPYGADTTRDFAYFLAGASIQPTTLTKPSKDTTGKVLALEKQFEKLGRPSGDTAFAAGTNTQVT